MNIRIYFKTSPQAQSSDFAEASTGQAVLDHRGQSSKSRHRRDYCGCHHLIRSRSKSGIFDLLWTWLS